MPLAHIEFQPKQRTPDGCEELFAKVDWYGACLWKDGRIADGYSTCHIGGGVRLSVYFIGRAAVSSGVKCSYTRDALAEVRELSRSDAKWVVTDSWSELDHVTRWKGAPAIVLPAPWIGECGPHCRHGGDGRIIPNYTLPLDDTAREQLTHWRMLSSQIHAVWLSSLDLESDCNAVLADCRSQHMTFGREYAAAIEETTGIPTYIGLFRYHSLGAAEKERRCPGCGGAWRRPPEDSVMREYRFRCERCRLISDDGSMDAVDKAAKIGEWRVGRKPIESAASLRKRFKSGKLVL